MQTLPTALNQAATTGMLTGPGFGLRALAAHSSGTDNGKFYLEVFVAAVWCVSPDSGFHLPAFNPADWRRGWCSVGLLLQPPCFCHPQTPKDIYCPPSHHALAVCPCCLFLLESSGMTRITFCTFPLCTPQSCTHTPVTVRVTAVTRVTRGRLLPERTGRGTSSFPGSRKQTI